MSNQIWNNKNKGKIHLAMYNISISFYQAEMLQMNWTICINLLHKVIFIPQGQFVSHLDRMPSVKGASVPILSIPKTVSKSAVTHIGMHFPPPIHLPTPRSTLIFIVSLSFCGFLPQSHIPLSYLFYKRFFRCQWDYDSGCFKPWACIFLSGPHLAILSVKIFVVKVIMIRVF